MIQLQSIDLSKMPDLVLEISNALATMPELNRRVGPIRLLYYVVAANGVADFTVKLYFLACEACTTEKTSSKAPRPPPSSFFLKFLAFQ